MEHSNKNLLNTKFTIPTFSGEFAEIQRKHRLLEGQEWAKRSMSYRKYTYPVDTDNDIEALVSN